MKYHQRLALYVLIMFTAGSIDKPLWVTIVLIVAGAIFLWDGPNKFPSYDEWIKDRK